MSNTNQSTAMVRTAADKHKGIMELFEKRSASIAALLPKHMIFDRFRKIVSACLARTPTLYACSAESVVRAVAQGAELGLEVGGLLGEAYLVPFKGTAQLIPGYKGLAKLARNSGSISTLEAHVVREGDLFEMAWGLETKLVHKPLLEGEPGKIIAAWAIAKFKDGSYQLDAMSRAEVDAIRDRSQAKDSGPWVTDYAEMAKKTVFKRLAKMLPLTPELEKALEHEAALESGMPSPIIDVDFVSDEDGVVETKPEPTRTDAMKEKLAEKVNGATTSNGAAT